MESPRSRRLAAKIAVLAVWIAWAPALAAVEWYEAYHQAEEAIAAERWSDAVRHLNVALEGNPRSGARVRSYGMRFVRYFPYLQLGIAYDRMGQPEAALQAFDTEERQGEVARDAEASSLLRTHRERVEGELAAQAARRRERVLAIVGEGLEASALQERQGHLPEALAALDRALAVAPEHLEARLAQERLRAAIAEDERRRRDEETRSQLRRTGREALEAGRHGDAVLALREALEGGPDRETSALLERAQRALAAELEAAGEAARVTSENRLRRAVELGEQGRPEEALAEVEGVLALDPDDRAARTLERRLLAQRLADRESAQRQAEVVRRLEEAQRFVATGDDEAALAAAHAILAVDSDHTGALELITGAYARLGDRLLAGRGAPPVLRFDPGSQAVGESPTAISSPRLRVTGTVYDDSPIDLQFLAAGREVGTATVAPRSFEGVWMSDFEWHHAVPTGVSEFDVVVTDRDGNRIERVLAVRYAPPVYRSWTFVGAVAGGSSLILGLTAVGWRRRRRRSSGGAGESTVAETAGVSRDSLQATQVESFPSADEPAGARLLGERYQLLDRVGLGSTGEVYRARDTLLDTDVALKLLRRDYCSDEAALERLRREVVLTREVSHPNVLKIFHLGDDNGRRYLTMQYVDGTDLAELIAAEAPLAAARALPIARKLAAALDALHRCGVLHRDIKPSNVLIDCDGEPRITDFGLARLQWGAGVTRHGVFLGTPAYASPEQALGGTLDPRSDLYSLGVVIFEMITARRLFSAPTPQEMLSMQAKSPPPDPAALVPGVSRALSDLVLRCLAKRRTRRFHSAADLCRALEEIERAHGPWREAVEPGSRPRLEAV